MTRDHKKKRLELNTETLRNLQPEELQRAAGARVLTTFPTDTQPAAGCGVTFTTCQSCWPETV